MKLTKYEISFLKSINISIENSTLVLLDSNKRYDFSEIKFLEIRKQKSSYEEKTSFSIKIQPFIKFLNYRDYIKKDLKIKSNIFLTLKNQYRLLVYSSSNYDLITTSKIIKKINQEINTPFKY